MSPVTSQLSYLCWESKDVLSLFGKPEGGKSGQLRAPHFLTGRSSIGNGWGTESAAENYTACRRKLIGKGENVR